MIIIIMVTRASILVSIKVTISSPTIVTITPIPSIKIATTITKEGVTQLGNRVLFSKVIINKKKEPFETLLTIKYIHLM